MLCSIAEVTAPFIVSQKNTSAPLTTSFRLLAAVKAMLSSCWFLLVSAGLAGHDFQLSRCGKGMVFEGDLLVSQGHIRTSLLFYGTHIEFHAGFSPLGLQNIDHSGGKRYARCFIFSHFFEFLFPVNIDSLPAGGLGR